MGMMKAPAVFEHASKARAGQMTVEFAVAFPILIVVAVIAVNALLFFGQCAAFDRIAREAVRVHATSPAYGQTQDQTIALITEALEAELDAESATATVSASGGVSGQVTYTALLRFAPTLLGLGLKSSVFGVALPCLEHSVTMTVVAYRPGVIL